MHSEGNNLTTEKVAASGNSNGSFSSMEQKDTGNAASSVAALRSYTSTVDANEKSCSTTNLSKIPQPTPTKVFNMIRTTTNITPIVTATTNTTTSTTTKITNQMSSQQPMSYPVVVHYLANFHQMCIVTALLPLLTLFTCFVTAYVFQYDEVHETHCRVYNIIPSISAITGVSPQIYFWRFSIAIHLGPRIPIAFVYKNHYRNLLDKLRDHAAPEFIGKCDTLIRLILVLNCIEIASLGGVTYISNRENYPIHEKIFITFMICSLCHMLATIKLHGLLIQDPASLNEKQRESIKWKKVLFAMSILSTIGLLIFFAKHRFYCHDLAFSWFAFFEYLIAIANLLYHFTIVWDFPTQYMIVVQASRAQLDQIFKIPKKLN